MNSPEVLLLDSFKENQTGNTVNFIWFIKYIGVVALFKD